MKSRWLLNLALLVVVAGIGLALYLAPASPGANSGKKAPVSAIDPGNIQHISITFPARAAVELQKQDGHWRLRQPYAARASDEAVAQILAVLAASAGEKLPGTDLAPYDLDHPALRLKLDQLELDFGTHNPIDGRQYVLVQGAIYLLDSVYSEAAAIQVTELISKRLLGFDEAIVGFDFSHLEQWQPGGLRLDRADKQWKVSLPAAKPNQKELDEWFDENWKTATGVSVEPYQPDSKTPHPFFVVKLANGKTVRFDKLRESPEVQLGRPDEGLLYHIPADGGFGMLNPPLGLKPQ